MKIFSRIISFVLSVIMIVSVLAVTAFSASKVYYPIDMSQAVLKSRIQQKASTTQDCAVVSMATIESYLYGTTSTADKKIVYDALVKKNKDDNYAYWGNCGYETVTIDWAKVYNQLSIGYPVIVHRPKQSETKGQHWAVVAGYKGSTSKIEKEKFIIVDVYKETLKLTDIYTSKEWRGTVQIDRMAYRNNGIAITSLSGIRFAIDHPAILHEYGVGHGVLGYITANENLTSIEFAVTNAGTGKAVYSKTVSPNAKSYRVFNLDAEFTFAKWPVGEYYFTIVAKTANAKRAYCKYFTISKSWPATAPVRNYTLNFDFDVPQSETIAHNGAVNIPPAMPEKEGSLFLGWNVIRLSDGKSYCNEGDWYTAEQIEASSYNRKLYKPGEKYNFGYEWIKGSLNCSGYSFYPVWEDAPVEAVPGDANDDGKVNLDDVALTLKYIAGWDIVSFNEKAADVTANGSVNLLDVTLLLQYIANWDVVLGKTN